VGQQLPACCFTRDPPDLLLTNTVALPFPCIKSLPETSNSNVLTV
jgi:hypothetical protein